MSGLTIDTLPRNHPARVTGIHWEALGEGEARRLREFGLDEGLEVELLHGAIGGGPLAVRLGRMTVALRRHVAAQIQVAQSA